MKVVISTDTLKVISNLIESNDNFIFYLSNNNVIIEVNNLLFSCRLLEGEYPSAIKAIESKNTYSIKVDKHELVDAIERGIVLATGDKKPSVLLDIDNQIMSISCRSIEYGSSYEQISVEGYKGEKINICLNVRYLMDLLKNINSKKVIIEFDSPNKPIIIKEENNEQYLSLILPIRNF